MDDSSDLVFLGVAKPCGDLFIVNTTKLTELGYHLLYNIKTQKIVFHYIFNLCWDVDCILYFGNLLTKSELDSFKPVYYNNNFSSIRAN